MRKQRRQMAWVYGYTGTDMSLMPGSFAAGMICLLAAGLLTGCGGSQNADTVTSLKIGVSVYDQYDTFLAEMMTDMAAELKNLEQEGNTSEIGRFVYPSNDAAFDAACQALKTVLAES